MKCFVWDPTAPTLRPECRPFCPLNPVLVPSPTSVSQSSGGSRAVPSTTPPSKFCTEEQPGSLCLLFLGCTHFHLDVWFHPPPRPNMCFRHPLNVRGPILDPLEHNPTTQQRLSLTVIAGPHNGSRLGRFQRFLRDVTANQSDAGICQEIRGAI